MRFAKSGDTPNVPIIQVYLHRDDIHGHVQACTIRPSPTVNKTEQRQVGINNTGLLFLAHKPTSKKAGNDKYPFKHLRLDTLRKERYKSQL